jgi:hypothetical protein
MSERDRGERFALVALLLTGIVFGLGHWAGAYNEQQRAEHEQAEAQPYQGALTASSFWKEHAGSPDSYRAVCDSPIDESQADLCQQWRSAQAAEQISGYTLVSLIFGLFGLVGLGFTVHLSNKATKAATDATGAAIHANTIAREIAQADRRAWLGIERVAIPNRITVTNDEVRFYVQATVRNYGQTPALSVWITFRFVAAAGVHAGPGVTDLFKTEWGGTVGAVVFPTTPYTSLETAVAISRDEMDAVSAQLPFPNSFLMLFLVVQAHYRVVGDASPHQTGEAHSLHAMPLGDWWRQTGNPRIVAHRESVLPAPWAD